MKRFLRWTVVALVVLVVATYLAFRLSPWPSVFVIAHLFSRGEVASEAALEKHVPSGVVAERNLRYGSGPDELFDLNHPADAVARPTIVWIHGGAWIAGSKDGVANYLKVLAGRGYTTVGVEYSTGRRSRYPTPVRQVNAALAYLTAHAAELRIDPTAIVLAGDSAGAQIAAQVSLITTNPAYAAQVGIAPTLTREQLRAVLLLSGAYDAEQVDFDGDYAWFLRTVLWAYSGVKNFQDDEQFRLMSITPHVTDAFPPTFVSSGNGDPLAPQAVSLAAKLRSLNVAVDSLFFPAGHTPALPHEYQFNLDIPEGRLALDRMLAFVDARIGFHSPR